MKPFDLFNVSRGFVPFYMVPRGHTIHVYTRWSGVHLSGNNLEQYHSNFLVKQDGITAVDGSMSRSIVMDPKELVKDITSENLKSNSG